MRIMNMIQRLKYILVIVALCSMPAVSMADDDKVSASVSSQIIMPSPELVPEEVVEIQLLGLKLTKGDSSSVEMQQVWAFAHPSNKAMTGPLARFAKLFDMPAYRPLLGHTSHQILRLAQSEDYVQMQVQVTGQDSQSYVYLWVVGRATSGPEAGSWMTLSVSAPAGGGTQS